MAIGKGLAELIEHSAELQHAAVDVKTRAERDERLKRAENDFPYFCQYYLPDYFSLPAAEYQKILYDVIQTKELTEDQTERLREMAPEDFQDTFRPEKGIKGIVDVEPRNHGKSTRMTFAYPLWRALFRKSQFIIVIGSSDTDAQGQIENIRNAIENNDRIIEDFGFMAGSPWNKGMLRFKTGVTVLARGKGGSLRGRRNRQYRPDLVILDDMLKDEEADSSTSRDKLDKWFRRTVQPLGKEAMIILVNTIANEDDLPSRLLKEIKNGDKEGWIGLRFSAEIPSKDGEEHGTPLWPDRFSWEELKATQKNIGSIAYAQEYLSRPLSDEDRIFKSSWIVRVRDTEIPSKLSRYEGIDPATGAHDLSAVVDIGRDRAHGKIYVLSSSGKKESTDTFMRRLIERYKLFRYRRAFMEAVTFQEVYRKQITAEAARNNISLPIRGVKTGRASKETRMMALSPLVENGLIVFGPGNEDLIDQLTGFPAAGYDDLCDALYYAVKASGMLSGMKDSDDDAAFSMDKVRKDGLKLRRNLKI